MRIGVFGGTFDPPHHGHLIVAGDAHSRLRLDRTLLVPSAVPPHKHAQVRASASQRLEMVRAAVQGDERFEVSDIELRRSGPSYTVDTLNALREQYGSGTELFFLIGVDAARELSTWRAPEEVVRLAKLVVLTRAGEEAGPEIGFPITPVSVLRIDISATDVRRRVAAGQSIRYLVPDAVRAIIEREGLYK